MNVVRSLLSVALLATTLLTSCAGSSVLVREPVTASLDRYAEFQLAVDSNVGEDVGEELAALERLTLENVRELGVFSAVRPGGGGESASCLRAEATVTHVRKVSAGARFWGGMLAGKAELRVELRLLDGATGESLGLFEVTGTSGSTGFSGGTGSAVDETATRIAELIADARRRQA